MYRLVASAVIAVVMACSGCASSSGVSGGSGSTETYDLPFERVQEAVAEALQAAGFRAVSQTLEEGERYSISARYEQRGRSEYATGGSNRSLRASLRVTVEALDNGEVAVRTVNPAAQSSYGASSESAYHKSFFEQLEALLERE